MFSIFERDALVAAHAVARMCNGWRGCYLAMDADGPLGSRVLRRCDWLRAHVRIHSAGNEATASTFRQAAPPNRFVSQPGAAKTSSLFDRHAKLKVTGPSSHQSPVGSW